MKKVKKIYDEILDIKKIQDMYDKSIRVNTKNKGKLQRFEYNYVSNITYIKKILETRKYVPCRYNIFMIKEPKIRLIMSQNIIDKVINHVVSKYLLVNVFDNSLINENVATRKNKGTDYGIKLLKKYINEIKTEEFYVLKFDISKYFYNIDHDILKKIIANKIKDKDAIDIINNIIESTNHKYINERISNLKENEIEKLKEKNVANKDKLIVDIQRIPIYKYGKGLPIGNMSSQFLAILYLNELDHFIKEKLKIKYYIRYMDDGILLHKDRNYLKYCLEQITKILDKYKLKLNNKTKICSINTGLEFLGFRFIIKNNKLIMKVKSQTKRKFKRKMKKLNKLMSENKIDSAQVQQVKSSYLGHLGYGQTRNLIKKNFKV